MPWSNGCYNCTTWYNIAWTKDLPVTSWRLETVTLRKKYPYSEFFWSVFSRMQTEYEDLLRKSPYSGRMRENTDQKNSEYRHFSVWERATMAPAENMVYSPTSIKHSAKTIHHRPLHQVVHYQSNIVKFTTFLKYCCKLEVLMRKYIRTLLFHLNGIVTMLLWLALLSTFTTDMLIYLRYKSLLDNHEIFYEWFLNFRNLL